MSTSFKCVFAAVLLLGAAATAPAQQAHPSFSVTVSGRGPAVILIPGLLSSGEVWKSTVERYQQHFTLHTVTLAGFGGPAPIGSPFLSTVRDEIIGYIRARKLSKPIVIGHSLGGFMAFWIASTAPDLVGGVVAVDGVPFLPALGNPAATAESMSAQAKQIASLYASLSPEQLLAQSRMAMAMMITAPADVETAMAWVSKSDAATAGRAVAELTTTDLRADVAKITAPALLIGALGSAPEPMRPALEKAYHAQVSRLPGARVKMAPGARHFIMFDDPAFLFAAFDQFFASLPAK
ncbi:MAG TPA: alpha/beta hydrolase [Vicinamibacterales bacterium]|nr:alpha/beta hydrolase [Vicinamibacterales bacterium]